MSSLPPPPCPAPRPPSSSPPTWPEPWPGSVIVDLAAERGGNCELTKPGETITDHGVTILGPLNLPSTIPNHASQMYAKNVNRLPRPPRHQGRTRNRYHRRNHQRNPRHPIRPSRPPPSPSGPRPSRLTSPKSAIENPKSKIENQMLTLSEIPVTPAHHLPDDPPPRHLPRPGDHPAQSRLSSTRPSCP